MLKNRKYKRRAIALVLVLVLVASAAILGFGYIRMVSIKQASADNLVESTRSRYLAESGLYHGLYTLRLTPTAMTGSNTTPLGPYSVDDTGDSYVLGSQAVVGQSDQYMIFSSATAGGITQTVNMKVNIHSEYEDLVRSLWPVHYWRLGETSGETAFDIIGGDDGTYINGVGRGNEGAIIHDTNAASQFDGVNDYVDLDELDLLNNEAATIIAWVYPESFTHVTYGYWARFIAKASSTSTSDTYWMLGVYPSGDVARLRFMLRTDDGLKELRASSGEVELNKWTFVAGVYNGSEIFLYEDGVLVGRRGHRWSIRQNDDKPTWIGGIPTDPSRRPWCGRIDDVAIFNYALSQSQIQALYDARVPTVEVLSWDE